MNLLMTNPSTENLQKGNDVSAQRWLSILQSLGHEVEVTQSYQGKSCDGLIALHAEKSSDSIHQYHQDCPNNPIILVFTGTDLYRDLDNSESARKSAQIADEIVVLQPKALKKVPEKVLSKTRVIYQSIESVPDKKRKPAGSDDEFVVLMVAHLRPVKDPMTLVRATEQLPEESNIHVYFIGGVIDEELYNRLQSYEKNNDRITLLGEKPRYVTLEYILGADVLVVPSRLEGGANVVSEAIACGTPVIASDIPGNRGLLGDYPGYFDVGDELELKNKLIKVENNSGYYEQLKTKLESQQFKFEREQERSDWKQLFDDLDRKGD